jgi:hypothetical protein
MRKAWCLTTFVLLCLAVAHSATPTDDDGMSNYLTRTEAQTKALQTRALLGDGKVALVLAGDPRLSNTERRYWQTISAEDGFGPGIHWLGVVLSNDDSDPLNVVRARYWLNLAKARHDTPVVEYDLCQLDRKTNPALPPCNLPIDDMRNRPLNLH